MRRLAIFVAGAFVMSLGAIVAGALLSPNCVAVTSTTNSDRTAVVLGAGMDADGRLHNSTVGRVEAAVALFENGVVEQLHMTGGRAVPDGPSAGAQMKGLAVALGVDAERISIEERSLSTLQNALFSQPNLSDAGSLILVSEGFHLTRAWLSFAWAGMPPDAVCHSTQFRASGGRSRGPAALLIRELAAFWFNAGRAALYSIALALGGSEAEWERVLE